MKIDELIKQLEEIKKKHGDNIIIEACDDEGNLTEVQRIEYYADNTIYIKAY